MNSQAERGARPRIGRTLTCKPAVSGLSGSEPVRPCAWSGCAAARLAGRAAGGAPAAPGSAVRVRVALLPLAVGVAPAASPLPACSSHAAASVAAAPSLAWEVRGTALSRYARLAVASSAAFGGRPSLSVSLHCKRCRHCGRHLRERMEGRREAGTSMREREGPVRGAVSGQNEGAARARKGSMSARAPTCVRRCG